MEIISVTKLPIIQNTNSAEYIELLKLDNITFDENDIKLGDCFLTKPQELFYVVKPNDTIESISNKFCVCIEDIKNLNNCEKVFYGQKVRIK